MITEQVQEEPTEQGCRDVKVHHRPCLSFWNGSDLHINTVSYHQIQILYKYCMTNQCPCVLSLFCCTTLCWSSCNQAIRNHVQNLIPLCGGMGFSHSHPLPRLMMSWHLFRRTVALHRAGMSWQPQHLVPSVKWCIQLASWCTYRRNWTDATHSCKPKWPSNELAEHLKQQASNEGKSLLGDDSVEPHHSGHVSCSATFCSSFPEYCQENLYLHSFFFFTILLPFFLILPAKIFNSVLFMCLFLFYRP